MSDQSMFEDLLPNSFFFEPPSGEEKSDSEGPFFGWLVGCGERIDFHKSAGPGGVKILLFGELFDARNPRFDSQTILDALAEASTPEQVISMSRPLSGEFVIAAILGEKFVIFGDACGQMELFFDFNNPTRFASSPDLLPGPAVTDPANEPVAGGNPLCDLPRGSTVSKLPANFCYSSTAGGIVRYFPTADCAVKLVGINEAVDVLCDYLKGVFTAMHARDALAVPVTAGYDSRLLTAACVYARVPDPFYYLYKHSKMSDTDNDIRIGGVLAEAIGVERHLLEYSDRLLPADEEWYRRLHRPRMENAARIMNGDKIYFGDRTVVNGNLGEIGRSYFGSAKSVDPECLAKLRNKKGDLAEIAKMQSWLASFDATHAGAENVLDLFYWEDRMANWAARAKTEYRLVTRVISPLNCHEMLTVVLGVPKKYRTYMNNRFYERAIHRLEPLLSPFPYNPGLKSTLIKTLISAGVYGAYKNMQIKHF